MELWKLSCKHILQNKAISSQNNRCKSNMPKFNTLTVAWLVVAEDYIWWKDERSNTFTHWSFLSFLCALNFLIESEKIWTKSLFAHPNTTLSCLHYINIRCACHSEVHISASSVNTSIIKMPFSIIYSPNFTSIATAPIVLLKHKSANTEYYPHIIDILSSSIPPQSHLDYSIHL